MVGLIAILFIATIIAINPAKNFASVRNVKRYSDLYEVLNALSQYSVDSDGRYPAEIDATERQIGTCTENGDDLCPGAVSDCADISSELAPGIIFSIPRDSFVNDPQFTGYTVRLVGDRLTLTSCLAEGTAVQVSR